MRFLEHNEQESPIPCIFYYSHKIAWHLKNLLFATNTATALIHSTQLKDYQQAWLDAWGKWPSSYETLGNLYVRDAAMHACFFPMPCEDDGGYDAAFGPPIVAKFESCLKPSAVTPNVMSVKWTDLVATPKGCSALIFRNIGFALHYNEEGLIEKSSMYRENFHTVTEYLGEMAAEKEEKELASRTWHSKLDLTFTTSTV
eukprot:scaffold1206_cov160-Amphora_coffeaeformis.AAC.3